MFIAYRLRKEYEDNYGGGVLATGTDSIDVLAELTANDGVILVPEHEHLKLAVLDNYPPLERDPSRNTETVAAPVETPQLAPGQVLAADGQPIDVPEGVVPGETPGWPIDEEGRPLRLDDEQRQRLNPPPAADPTPDAPGSSRTGRRSTPSESKE